MNDKKLTREQMDALIEENEHVFELKDDILEMCEGFDFDDIEKAFMMAFTDLLLDLCNSKQEAIDRMATIAAKVMFAIHMFDANGECDWNTKQ